MMYLSPDEESLESRPKGTRGGGATGTLGCITLLVGLATLGAILGGWIITTKQSARLEAELAKTIEILSQVPRLDPAQTKFTFSMFTDYPPYAMWVSKASQPDMLGGIGYEFGQLACQMCGYDCTFLVDSWDMCWTNNGQADVPGDGLRSLAYDGCSTYTNQYQRQWSLDFSYSFMQKNKPAGILSRLNFDGTPKIPASASDLTGFTICDVTGWAPTIKSLSYSTNGCNSDAIFKNYKTFVPSANGPDAAMKAMMAGKCDGIYMYSDMIETKKVCDGCAWDVSLYQGMGKDYAWIHTGVVEHMANGTTLVMTRKGSGVAERINPCITAALQSPEYHTMCEKYGVSQECYPNAYFTSNITHPAFVLTDEQRTAKCKDHPEMCSCALGYCPCS